VIGRSAFERNQISTLVIGNGVTSLGYRAFAQNQLTNVVIPGSVRAVGRWAFAWNPTLETIRIPFATRTMADFAWRTGWGLGVGTTVVILNNAGAPVTN